MGYSASCLDVALHPICLVRPPPNPTFSLDFLLHYFRPEYERNQFRGITTVPDVGLWSSCAQLPGEGTSCVPPLTRPFTKSSSKSLVWIFIETSDTFWRGFGTWRHSYFNSCCDPARSRFWQTLDSYPLISVSSEILRACRGSVCSLVVLPYFIFALEIVRIQLLNWINCWNIVSVLIPCARSPNPGKEAPCNVTTIHHFLDHL